MEKVFSPKLFGLIKDGSVKKNLSKDILAGIVVGIVALPLAIAFAVASGVSPEKGIITAIVAGFLISFFGGSRVQIGGPTGAFIIIVYGIVNDYGLDGMIISTIFAGVIMIGFGMLRLGTLLKFIPHRFYFRYRFDDFLHANIQRVGIDADGCAGEFYR